MAGGGQEPLRRSALLQSLGALQAGRASCSQWPHSPGHTRSIPGAPAGRPRIAGIPGEGPSSPASLSSVSAASGAASLVLPPPHLPASSAHTLTSARPGFPREGRKVRPASALSCQWAFLARQLHFLLCAVRRTAFDCPWLQVLCSAPSGGSCREEALRLPFSLWLEPGGRGGGLIFIPRHTSRH